MKRLYFKFVLFFKKLFEYRTVRKFKKINAKLEQTLEDREVDRIILKGKIVKMVRKYLRVDAKSKFIPKHMRNNTEIRERVLAEFGEQMNKLGIKINDKLELV